MASTVKVPNETSEERQKREDAERIGKDIVADLKTRVDDEKAIDARVDESEKDREKRKMQHISDDAALQNLGRVREIADSLDRDRDSYQTRRDNAVRRLKGLAGDPNKVVRDAVQAVAKNHGIEVTAEGLVQPKSTAKKGDATYPFAD